MGVSKVEKERLNKRGNKKIKKKLIIKRKKHYERGYKNYRKYKRREFTIFSLYYIFLVSFFLILLVPISSNYNHENSSYHGIFAVITAIFFGGIMAKFYSYLSIALMPLKKYRQSFYFFERAIKVAIDIFSLYVTFIYLFHITKGISINITIAILFLFVLSFLILPIVLRVGRIIKEKE
jgi:hypothetical protein